MAAGCSGVCKQFLLLLWKNFILQIRRPIGTVAEILIPILAVVFVLGLRHGLFQRDDRCFVTFDPEPLTPTNPINVSFGILPRVIVFTPDNEMTRDIMDLVSSKLPPDPLGVDNVLQGVASETELLTELDNLGEDAVAGCLIGGAGVVFDFSDTPNIQFTLRLRHEVGEENSWLTRETSPNFEPPGPRITDNFYLSEGFLHLQNAVGLSIIQYLADQQEPGSAPNITVEMRQFPFPDYSSDIFLLTIGAILPLLLMLAFIYSAGSFVKELVLEKETRIRESMFMMGLTQWILWASWYLKQFIFLLVSVIVMTILIKGGQVFPESNGFLVFIFFLLFILSMISYSFLLSVFFDSARIGQLVGFLGWFLNYLPFLFIAPRYDEISTGGKIGACILSNTCMGLGIEVFARLESRQEGLQFDNVAEPLNLDDSFHMGYVYMMLIIDSIVYYVLAWYINNVKPGQYGVPKPFYFPFLLSYWTGKPRKSRIKEARDLATPDAGGYDPTAHETEPTDLTVGITIDNLTKIYGTSWFSNLTSKARHQQEQRKVAVNKLSLNMYKDQITALLGHNGAGKTTTMSILTGLFTPTSGSATINGLSILTDMDQIRHSLGICPQHNVLFDRLTVAEHLKFFCRLKGVWDSTTVRNEVESMIADLQLVGKGDVPSKALSGGMKRKLSVGIALVGGSEVVVLDEPTSGMDPYARRATWDLLVKHKQGRTMLLTTHFMDEADLLGDRIAIMADGQLKCSGSSLFLKSRYGIGYHMTVVKEQHCDSARVTQVVKSMVAGAQQVSDAGAELSFILPSSSTAQFPALFDVLEARKTELAVSSFGVSVTTMEEVFIKVGEGTEETLNERIRKVSVQSHDPTTPKHVSQTPTTATIPEEVVVHSDTPTKSTAEVADLATTNEDVFLPGQPTTRGATPLDDPTTDRPQVAETQFSLEESDEHPRTDTAARLTQFQLPKNYAPNSGLTLWFQQFVAMFLKRFYNSLRFFAAVFTQLLMPMLFVLLALILAKTLPNPNEDDAPRELRLDNSALSSNITLFYAQLQNPTGFNLDFSDVTPESLGVSDIFNRTRDVQDVMMNAETGSDPQQCCSYTFQLLDKFCATRTETQLQDACSEDDDGFGYTRCRDRCLSCCTAQETRLPSCTNPISQIGRVRVDPGDSCDRGGTTPQRDDFCPSPPRVSYQDAMSGSPTGALDSETTFVAEDLMRFIDQEDVDTVSFFRRYQAGYTITTRDPPYAACGCQNDVVETCEDAFELLGDQLNFTEGQCPYYTVLGECGGASPPDACIMCDPGSSVSGCSTFDGIATNLLQNTSCNACPGNQNSVGAVSPTPDQSPVVVTVWYNNQPWHMSAAALNSFHNILLRQTLNSSYTITVINHPRPRSVRGQIDTTNQNFIGYAVGTLVVFGYSFFISTFILFIVQEKESKAKHLQFVSGVHITSFWSATFAWDVLNASLPVIISLILFAAFQVDGYTGDGLGAVFLLFIFVVWASIPLTYVFSFLFKNYLAAFGIFFCFYYFSAVVMQTIVFLITDQNLADTLHYIFLIFPSYGLAIGLNDLFINNIARGVCTLSETTRMICADPCNDLRFVENALDFPRPGIGSILLYMALEGIVFFMFAMLLEAKFFIPELKGFLVTCKNGNNHQEVDEEALASDPLLLHGEDTDVLNERKKVMMGQTTENDVVVIKNLQKVYPKRLDGCTVRPAKAAVQGISLAIPNRECFGLLGVNGAGKTTTFSIITGDIPMTEGTASISGFDIRTNLRDVQQRIGYCPQFDALINRLTGRELLTMYGRLRGIPEHLLKDAVEAIIQTLDISKYGDKQCGTYSGGNKRKLSTGIALVGNPSIVLLDEPSTGMDVDTRRHLWDVLTSVIREGRSIVLTSHSMEECEALCTRLAIMVNGRFKCLGSIQHLKNKYGAGFTLQAKVQLTPSPVPDPQESVVSSGSLFSLRRQASREKSTPQPQEHSPSPIQRAISPTSASSRRGYERQVSGGEVFTFNPFDATALHNFIREVFPGAVLLEEHQGAVGYQLPGTGITWSSIFRQIESNKERLGIVDYSVSQTTLDQVFINFAREQEDSEI